MTNDITASETNTAGAGATPSTTSKDYAALCTGVAVGGAAGASGTSGCVVIRCE
jgi:hypothetical protein